MKIKITWPDGHEEVCCDYDSPEALAAGMWGSTPIPEGTEFAMLEETEPTSEEGDGNAELAAALQQLHASTNPPQDPPDINSMQPQPTDPQV